MVMEVHVVTHTLILAEVLLSSVSWAVRANAEKRARRAQELRRLRSRPEEAAAAEASAESMVDIFGRAGSCGENDRWDDDGRSNFCNFCFADDPAKNVSMRIFRFYPQTTKD